MLMIPVTCFELDEFNQTVDRVEDKLELSILEAGANFREKEKIRRMLMVFLVYWTLSTPYSNPPLHLCVFTFTFKKTAYVTFSLTFFPFKTIISFRKRGERDWRERGKQF
ncbi:MAG: hypothetical protein OCU22_09960 [Canidatus Methanoxibalbensis ujae]|nr:hypothetical protein [Candidatus Methanoxibalbensis ujae]